MELPAHLDTIRLEITDYAKNYGLDFFETIFEIVDYDQINQIAAYGGFPTRYPHWTFGMEYERMEKSYTYGLSKIYEMVINNDPCYAYLLESNPTLDQKLVIAHVYGHCDFFKNNYYFSKTNRKMMDEMANHATRIRRYMERFGVERVESFIDVCISIDNLIDYHSPFIKRKAEKPEEPHEDIIGGAQVHKLPSKDYMDPYINPKEYLDQQREKQEREKEKSRHFPVEPERDIMGFLLDHAQLSWWEKDVLAIVRDEAYYFAPQGMTKIMNEGWASYWHSKILTQKALNSSEIIDFADRHAGCMVMQKGSINPYKIGIELFRDIEERWNKGQFGPEWENCDNFEERRHWDKKLGLGKEKIFEVRKLYNDVTFIDTFLTPEFVERVFMYTYGYNKRSNQYEITSKEFKQIKDTLLFQLTNFGQPFIYVKDANFGNRGELYLWHRHEGVDLKLDYARDTLRNLHKLWKRPVNLETVFNKKKLLLSFNGSEHKEKNIS